MKKTRLSAITIIVCLFACAFMGSYIVKDYVLPIIKGTISDNPNKKIFSEEDVPVEIRDLLNENAVRYAYTQLNKDEKKAYDQMLLCILSISEKADVTDCKLSIDEIKKVYSSVRNDYPEIFWIYNHYNVYCGKKNLVTDFMPSYVYDSESIKNVSKNLVEVKNTIIEKTYNLPESKKIDFVFNYIIDYTEYDEESYESFLKGIQDEKLETSSSIYGTLFKGKALCEGYSKSIQFLLNAIGFECIYVSGQAGDEGHAWNYVKIEDSYYAIDATWCDPKSQINDKTYAYYMVDYDTISLSHKDDMPYKLPECKGGKYEYYSYNGYELTSFSYNEVEKMIFKAYSEGKSFVEIHCTSDETYNALVNALGTQEIFSCFDRVKADSGKNVDEINYGVVADVKCVRIILPFVKNTGMNL